MLLIISGAAVADAEGRAVLHLPEVRQPLGRVRPQHGGRQALRAERGPARVHGAGVPQRRRLRRLHRLPAAGDEGAAKKRYARSHVGKIVRWCVCVGWRHSYLRTMLSLIVA